MRIALRAFARRRARHLFPLIAALALGLAAPAAAEPLRLDDVVAIALRDNPVIANAGQRADALRERPAQASAFDDPTLSWEAWDIPESLRVDEAENNIFRLSQKVPFPGKRRLAGEAATHEADAAGEDVRTTRLEVQAAVTRAYADLWLAGERAQIIARDRILYDRLAHTAESQYAIGQTPQADVLRAQVELTHSVIEQRTAGLAIDAARADLNALLSRTPDAPLGDPEPPAVRPIDTPLATLIERALGTRPELAGQRAMIDRETSGVELAELGYWPDFEVSVGRFLNYGRSDGFGAMASVTLPFAHLDKYRAAVGEARVRVSGAESALRGLQDRVRRDVARAYAQANAAALEYELAHSTHVPHAEQAVQANEAAYASGAVDFASLLDALRTMQDTHLQHAEAAADYLRSVADLERAIGGPLDAAPE
ncbi:MAG TPA: TolC family protein [Candidatus Dormibacteraeota bacterium]|nr:TolC family protein [Candidatus Dormibacteraeota bacterium]